jgi:transcriptional regulator with XRE-family HTH domain
MLDRSKLRDARKRAGYSQFTLAVAANLHVATIQAYERGVRTPDSAVVHKLETVLGESLRAGPVRHAA